MESQGGVAPVNQKGAWPEVTSRVELSCLVSVFSVILKAVSLFHSHCEKVWQIVWFRFLASSSTNILSGGNGLGVELFGC